MKFFDLGAIVLFLAIFTALNAYQNGLAGVQTGLATTGRLTIKTLPLITLIFLLMGQSEVWAGANVETLKAWLKGSWGICFGGVAGLLCPSILGAYGIVKPLWTGGVNPFALINFLFSAQLLAFPSLMFRMPFLGPELMQAYSGTCVLAVVGMTCVLLSHRTSFSVNSFSRSKKGDNAYSSYAQDPREGEGP